MDSINGLVEQVEEAVKQAKAGLSHWLKEFIERLNERRGDS